MRASIFFVIFFYFGLLSCNRNKTVISKVTGKENCYELYNHDVVCLDMYQNLDTAQINHIIKNKRTLLIFTGWAISGKSLVDEENLKKYKILNEIKHYSIIIQYVDDRRKFKETDSFSIGQFNMAYQQMDFKASSQPQYIIFSNGKKQCETFYFGNNEKQIVQFLGKCIVP